MIKTSSLPSIFNCQEDTFKEFQPIDTKQKCTQQKTLTIKQLIIINKDLKKGKERDEEQRTCLPS